MINNYRPVSMIPVLAKVFVHQQLYDYLEKNYIKEEQTGFRPNRSTQDILLKTVEDWKRADITMDVPLESIL